MAQRKKAGTEPRAELSRLELDVMGVVWDLGECGSAEVIGAFRKKRRLADTTVRNVLANLRKKGYVEPIPTIERRLRFRPVVARDAIAKNTLTKVVDGLFGGSARRAILQLLDEKPIDAEELDEIRRRIDARKRKETK